MSSTKFSSWTFVLLFLLSLILVVHLLFNFITPMIMSLALASLFNPMHLRLKKFFPKSPYLAAFLSTFLVFLLVMIPLGLFILSIAKEVLNIYQISTDFAESSDYGVWVSTIKSTLDRWQKLFADMGFKFSSEHALKTIVSMVNTFGMRIYEALTFVAVNLAAVGLSFILTVLLVFVFFMNGSSIRQFFMDLIPLPKMEKEQLAAKFNELAKAIFIGNGLISITEGIIGGILFYVFGIPAAAIFGFAIVVTAFLPLIGSSIIIVPASIYLYLQGRALDAILFLTLNTIQLSILEMLVKPKLIGDKTDMHAVLVFLSIIAGIQVYGIFGLFYGPLLVTMFLTLNQMYKEHYRDMLL